MSGLPQNNTPWPPPGHSTRYRRMQVYDAWYSGDPEKLKAVYGGQPAVRTTGGPPTTLNPTGNRVTRAVRAAATHLWGNPPAEGEQDTRRHLPTANDIAVISSELLHADPPTITVVGPVYEEDGPVTGQDPEGRDIHAWRAGDPMPETVAAQQRLDYLLDASHFHALLLAASETQSALGSVALRVAFDKAVHQHPVLTRVDADAVIPYYTWGLLDGTTFWRIVRNGDDGVWRHLEHHGNDGRIYHGLYKGDADSLGIAVPLSEHPSTAALAAVVQEDGALPFTVQPVTGAVPRTAVSIPNKLPDPLDRLGSVGASDYNAAVIDLLDAGDKLWSDMMTAADDAKSRIIISKQLLESRGPGAGVTFDMNQRVFQKVNLPAPEKEGGAMPIEKVQFEMRLAEYWAGIEALYDRTIKAAGYNPQTMGTEQVQPQTATEYSGKNKRSLSTRAKKIRYWQEALESLLTGLLAVDAQEFGSGIKVYPVRVEYPDAVQPATMELLAEAKLMKEIGVATLTELVQHVHPDWSAGEVKETVDEIMSTTRAIDPITLDLGGQNFGVPMPPGQGI